MSKQKPPVECHPGLMYNHSMFLRVYVGEAESEDGHKYEMSTNVGGQYADDSQQEDGHQR